MRSRLRHIGVVVGAMIVLLLVSTLCWKIEAVGARDEKTYYPREILIIRHAEKPPEESKSFDLSAEGNARAAALPDLFKTSEKRPNPFAAPDFIFAAKNTKHSHRPLETVAPLAKKLNRTVNSQFADEDFSKLADEIFQNSKYAGKTILISWHHGMIPPLAQKLKAMGMPEHWKGTVFDRVWQITYDAQGKSKFVDLPQQLLPKDSQK
jgi:hypothetical protein